jgi:hypothetical protein
MTAKANWTGVEGVIKMDGSTIAWASANVKLSRGTASHGRGASESDVYRQGKFDAEGEFTEILTNGAHMSMLMNATPTTGTAGAALAASTAMQATAGGEYTAFTDTEPTTPSRVKLTLITQNATVAGTATVIGEDANGEPIEETFDIPATMVVNDTLTGKKVFGKAFAIITLDVDTAADGGQFKVDYIAGDASVSIGRGSLFTYIFSVEDGSNYVRHTWTNCFFTSASTSLGDADEMAEVSYGFRPQDPAADCTYAYVNA